MYQNLKFYTLSFVCMTLLHAIYYIVFLMFCDGTNLKFMLILEYFKCVVRTF